MWKNFYKFWWKLSWHNGLNACRVSEFFLKSCIYHSLSRCAWRIFQDGKSTWVCQDFVMRKKFIPFWLSLTQKPFVVQTSNFGVILIRHIALFNDNFVLIWALLLPVLNLLVLIRVACIKISWNFVSNIESCFLIFLSYLNL